MKRYLSMAAGLLCLAVAACAGTAPASVTTAVDQVNATLPAAFKYGCAAVSYADGAFQVAAPALLAAGKLTQADFDSEKPIYATVQKTCENPPPDAATAGLALLGQASAIYLLLAPKT